MISGDPKDPDYFALVQEKMKPRGSTLPHPADWKGKGLLDEKDVLVLPDERGARNRIASLNPVAPADYEHKFKTKDGRRRKMSRKQMLQAQYMLQGYTRRQAMLKAGYSEGMSSKSSMKNQKTVLSFFEGVRGRFSKLGVDENFVAEKMKEWMNAHKLLLTKEGEIDVPDYKTQIDGYDRFTKLIDPEKTVGTKKREVKLTEWITGDKEGE